MTIEPEEDFTPTRNIHAGWTVERQRLFIQVLGATGSVTQAARAGVGPQRIQVGGLAQLGGAGRR